MAVNWQALEGFGYKSATQSVAVPPIGQQSQFASSYNNQNQRIRFKVDSFVPGNGPFRVNEKAKEFDAAWFPGVLNALGSNNTINIPYKGFGEYLFNPNVFTFPPDFIEAWANFFAPLLKSEAASS